MIDKKYLIGVLIGFGISALFIPVQIDAAIPPTPAWKSLNILTSTWYASDTDVNATSYNDQVFFVSDGSITFNVTSTYP